MSGSLGQNIKNTNLSEQKTLAIVPFRLLRGTDKTPLGIGLADALTIRLHGVQGLSVRPTSSVLQFIENITDAFELGRHLGVDYILDGHILPAGERTRFSVQLLDISNHNVLWAAHFDESETDIFHLEDSISARIVELLVPQLTETTGEQPISEKVAVRERKISAPLKLGNENATAESDLIHDTRNDSVEIQQQFETEKPKSRIPLFAALALFVVVGGAFGYFLFIKKSPLPSNTQKTIVVLPFKSENSPTNSVGVGLADALTGKLGTIHNLTVLSANAGRTAANAGKDARTIGRELSADFVLSGSLQTAGDRKELSTELINVETGEDLFTVKLQPADSDLLALQTELAERVLNALAIVPTNEERARLSKRHTENALAYELYLVGRYQMTDRSVNSLNKAVNIFAQSRDRDPNFALAYVGLADAYSLLNLYQIPPPPDGYQKAEENARKAIALDESLPEAHLSLSYVEFYGNRRRKTGEQEFRRAIELNPSLAMAHHWFGLALAAMNRLPEAIEQISAAERLDPRSAIIKTASGMIYFYAGQYDKASEKAQNALEIERAFIPAHKLNRWINEAKGDYNAALAALQKERSFAGGSEFDIGWTMVQAQVEAVGGHREAALALLRRAEASKDIQNNPSSYAYEIALAYALLGDSDKTVAYLEKAAAASAHSFNFIAVEPRFGKARQDARFAALVQQLDRQTNH